MDLIEILQQEWAIRALLASSMVGIMCGALGSFIVLRNMSLFGDALAHAILPGVVVAFMVLGYSTLGFFTGAVGAGLIAAVAITWIQHKSTTKNDAAIGIVFTAMFSLGVMGISWISRNEGVHLDLKDFLFGNVLGVSNQDLYLTAAVAVYVLLCIMVFYRYLFVTTFQPVIAQTMGISIKLVHYFLMLLLSFAVVASLQMVGVILVVAMLITPSSTALLLSNRLKWVVVLSAVFGLLSALLGLLAAIWLETTPGPAMAVVATLLYLVVLVIAPEKGLLAKWRYRMREQARILGEDVLKRLFRKRAEKSLGLEDLRAMLEADKKRIQGAIRRLRKDGYLEDVGMELTEKGAARARRLVRAHRLWETYLVDELGLTAEQIHEDAEQYEHLLTDEILDEMDRQLGFPSLDPHGSPIPARAGLAPNPLSQLAGHASGRIAERQISDQVSSYLWSLGLLPGTEFEIEPVQGEHDIHLRVGDRSMTIKQDMAHMVNVEGPNSM